MVFFATATGDLIHIVYNWQVHCQSIRCTHPEVYSWLKYLGQIDCEWATPAAVQTKSLARRRSAIYNLIIVLLSTWNVKVELSLLAISLFVVFWYRQLSSILNMSCTCFVANVHKFSASYNHLKTRQIHDILMLTVLYVDSRCRQRRTCTLSGFARSNDSFFWPHPWWVASI